MAEIRFNCPKCSQLIACDELWAGHDIQCPTCQAEIAVPQNQAGASGNPLVPKPPSTPAPRLTAGTTQVARSSSALSPPIRQLAPKPQKKKSPLMKIIVTILVLAGLGVGGYYGWGWLRERQEKLNAKRREVEKTSDGGEVGHIANLYDVLDATEPGGRGLGGGSSRATGPRQRSGTEPRAIPIPADASGAALQAAEKNLPVIPAIWTLEVASAKIPEGRVNGMISGTNFLAETIRVEPTATAQVFRLTQGALASPDREFLVYLHLKPGETIAGHTWSVSKDMKANEVPQVTKRWKTNPRYAPLLKQFPAGYAMKLEFGPLTNGVIPGRVFLALPDTEHSVAAGLFIASTATAETSAAAQPAPTVAPAQPAMSASEKAAFEKRYGPVKR